MGNHTGSHRIEGGADLAEKRAILRFEQAFEDLPAAAAGVGSAGGLRHVEFHSGIVLAVIGIELEAGTGNDTQPPPFGITGGHHFIDEPDRRCVAFIFSNTPIAVFKEGPLPGFGMVGNHSKSSEKFISLKACHNSGNTFFKEFLTDARTDNGVNVSRIKKGVGTISQSPIGVGHGLI